MEWAESKKEEKEIILSDEDALRIVEENERQLYGESKELKPGWLKKIFAPSRRFFKEMRRIIEKEGILGFVVEKVFPLLYFPGWKEMWKMREEQRRREIMLGSVGRIRNAFEGLLSGITGDLVRDKADYERRAQMLEVKKETEELVSDEMEYLLDELNLALEAGKMSRAEACVRKLEATGNLNEILRNPITARGIRRWDDQGIYGWITKVFGTRRGHYMLMDFAEHFATGHERCKGMIYYDLKKKEFVKEDPKEQALFAASEAAKIQVEGEWRNKSHLSAVDEYYGLPTPDEEKKLIEEGYYIIDKETKEKKFYHLKPSEILKARLIMVGVETIGRGLGRANEKLLERMELIADSIQNYIQSEEFDWYVKKMAEMERRELKPNELETRRELAMAFLANVLAKRKGIILREDEAVRIGREILKEKLSVEDKMREIKIKKEEEKKEKEKEKKEEKKEKEEEKKKRG